METGEEPTTRPTKYALTTASGTLRTHLAMHHCEEWVDACDEKQYTINTSDTTIIAQVEAVRAARGRRGNSSDNIPNYSPDNLADALAEFFIGDDVGYNKIESPRFRRILLMLRKELRECDIPHRQSLRDRVIFLWNEQVESLKVDLQVS